MRGFLGQNSTAQRNGARVYKTAALPTELIRQTAESPRFLRLSGQSRTRNTRGGGVSMSAREAAQSIHVSFRYGEPQLRWLPRRGKYYIACGVDRHRSLISTGTANLEEAEVSLSLFKRSPDDFFTARRKSPWRKPMLPTKSRLGVIYFVGCDAIRRVKIGFAGGGMERRMKELQCGSPVELTVLATAPGTREHELLYHELFAPYRLHGEWFERCPEIEAEITRLNAASPKSNDPSPEGFVR